MKPFPDQEKKQRNSWFEERRDLFVKNMLKEFYETLTVFIEIYEKNLSLHTVSFEQIDRLVGRESDKGLLWRLKDRCHQLWRDTDPRFEINGFMLDWIMGSLFHEAMKLKENIYMSQFYGPLADSMNNNDPADAVMLCGMECQLFMERTGREIEKQVESLGVMFGRANYLLRIIMHDQAKNPLMVRYLIENEQVVEELWSESLPDLFRDMFGEHPEEGFCLAGRSYMEGQWFKNAYDAYTAAVHINPNCAEALENIDNLRALLKNNR